MTFKEPFDQSNIFDELIILLFGGKIFSKSDLNFLLLFSSTIEDIFLSCSNLNLFVIIIGPDLSNKIFPLKSGFSYIITLVPFPIAIPSNVCLCDFGNLS